jgi:CubicO group peptidase (beta-lactamase class C family)
MWTALVAVVALAAPLPPLPTQGGTLEAELRAALDREAQGVEGLSVAIAIGDDLLLCEGRGYADVAAGRRATGDTRWRAGALYPPLAALALLRLAQEGRVDLDAPVADLLPALEGHAGEPVLVRHLLQHTSGLPSYLAWHEARSHDTSTEPEAILAWLATQPLDTHPGRCFAWSNSNALVTGLIVEELTAEPLAEYLERTLLEPLDLRQTAFDGEGVPCREAIHACYEVGGQPVSDGHALLPFGAERLCASAPDLVGLVRGLAARRVLDDATWRALLVPARGEDGEEVPWSLGVGLAALDGHRGLVLGGGHAGHRVHVAYYPTLDLSVAVLGAGCQAPVAEIERRLTRILLDLPEPGIVDLPVSPEEVGVYVGAYYLGCTRLVIFPAEGSLWLGAPAEPDVRLMYQGRDVFVREDDPDVRLVFQVEAPGEPAHAFVLIARGAQSVARRLD